MKRLAGVGALVRLLAALICLPGARAAAAPPVSLVNPGFEQGATGWSLPSTYAVVDDVAHSGAHSLRQINADPAFYELASLQVPFTRGKCYRFGAWVRTRGVKGDESGATVCMEWSGPGGYLGGVYPTGRKGDNDWYHVEDVTAPIPAEATRVTITVYMRKGMTGTAWYDDVTVVPYTPPFTAALTEPSYRDTLWADEAEQPIALSVYVPEDVEDVPTKGGSLVCEVLRAGRICMRGVVHGPSPGDREVSLDGRRLPPGEFRIRATLLSAAGRPLAVKEAAFRKMARGARRPEVYIDSHRRLIVRGKPFFPLGLYFGPDPHDADFRTHIDRVAASPFNTIMCYSINSVSVQAVRTYLDYLQSRGVKILYSIKDNFKGTDGYGDPLLGFHGEEGITRGIVGTFRSHPAVIGWYTNDELSLDWRERLEARYRLLRTIDPDHPTWAVLYQVGQMRYYLGTADVLGSDPYPVPKQPLTMVGDWTRQTAAASVGHKAVWEVPQIMDWACYNPKEPGLRAPTLDEMLVMSYLALIRGATGLVYYSYFDLMRDPHGFDRRWADALLLGAEMKRLFPALLSTRKPPSLPVRAEGGDVRWSLRGDDSGRSYVLLANVDAKSAASVTVGVPPRSRIRILRRGAVEAPAFASPFVLKLPPLSAATVIVAHGAQQ